MNVHVCLLNIIYFLNLIFRGPSIIFSRYQEANKTYIRNGDKLCKSIHGYDSNSLYLWAFTQEFPVGAFIRRLHEDNFKPILSDRFTMMFRWLEFYSKQHGVYIEHKMNSKTEFRLEKYLADGYSKPTGSLLPGAIPALTSDIPVGSPLGTLYEFDGCFFHGHRCHLTKHADPELMKERAKRTEEKHDFYRKQGYDLIVKRECTFLNEIKSNPQLREHIDDSRPTFYQKNKGEVSEEQILEAVKNNDLFGAIECDIQIPDKWTGEKAKTMELTPYDYFSEMSPLFLTTDVKYEDIGAHMQNHIESNQLSKKPRTLLVGGIRAKKIARESYSQMDAALFHWM